MNHDDLDLIALFGLSAEEAAGLGLAQRHADVEQQEKQRSAQTAIAAAGADAVQTDVPQRSRPLARHRQAATGNGESSLSADERSLLSMLAPVPGALDEADDDESAKDPALLLHRDLAGDNDGTEQPSDQDDGDSLDIVSLFGLSVEEAVSLGLPAKATPLEATAEHHRSDAQHAAPRTVLPTMRLHALDGDGDDDAAAVSHHAAEDKAPEQTVDPASLAGIDLHAGVEQHVAYPPLVAHAAGEDSTAVPSDTTPSPSEPEVDFGDRFTIVQRIDIDPDLLQAFDEESTELLDALHIELERLEEDADDHGALLEARRIVHTIKGGAKMCGFEGIVLLTHAAENLLDLITESAAPLDMPALNALFESEPLLRTTVQDAISGVASDVDPLIALAARFDTLCAAAQAMPVWSIDSDSADARSGAHRAASPELYEAELDITELNRDALLRDEPAGDSRQTWPEAANSDEDGLDLAGEPAMDDVPVDAPAWELRLAERADFWSEGDSETADVAALGAEAGESSGLDTLSGEALRDRNISGQGGAEGTALRRTSFDSPFPWEGGEGVGDNPTLERSEEGDAGSVVLDGLYSGERPHPGAVPQTVLAAEATVQHGQMTPAVPEDVPDMPRVEAFDVAVAPPAMEAIGEPSADADAASTHMETPAAPEPSAAPPATEPQAQSSISGAYETTTLRAPTVPLSQLPLAETPSNGTVGASSTSRGQSRRSTTSINVDLAKVDAVAAKLTELAGHRASAQGMVGRVMETSQEARRNVMRLHNLVGQISNECAAMQPVEAENTSDDDLSLETYSTLNTLILQLQEAVSDQQALVQEIHDAITGHWGYQAAESRVDADIQGALMNIRLVPIANMRVRLDGVVRQAAESTGKLIRWQLQGGNVAVEKSVFDRLFEPLMHLLRNAIDHGIETPVVRREIGKPETGIITVTAQQDNNQIVITLSDDGAGIVPNKIASLAVERGLITAEQASEMTYQQKIGLIFAPGFSTAREISHISGRGVGMDVVRESCLRMGGSIDVSSKPGVGTTFTLRLPLSLSVTRGLLVRDGGCVMALPVSQVVALHLVSVADLVATPRGRVARLEGQELPVYNLPPLHGAAATSYVQNGEVNVLQIAHEGGSVGLLIEDVLGEEEILIKTPPTILRGVKTLLGAYVLPDGRVAPVVNVQQLLQSIRPVATLSAPQVEAQKSALTALVVDDSMSMRVALSGTLQSAGFKVLTARDGQEALDVMKREGLPNLVTLDVEMPRMDGLETLFAIRQMAGAHDLPVFMMTSRGGSKHRRAAEQLGATRYFTKPYRDSELAVAAREVCSAS